MKQLAIVVLLVLGLILVGCGGPGNPANINGVWNASLIDSSNTSFFTLGMSLIVNGDGTLSISNFKFTSASPCLVSAETESGSFTLSGNFNGNVTGSFGFLVSGNPGATLNLTGTATGNTISGTWTLKGSGCSGNGTFIMTKM